MPEQQDEMPWQRLRAGKKQSVSGGNGILVQGGRAVLTCTYGKDTDPVVETIDTGSKTRRTIDGPTLCPSGRSGERRTLSPPAAATWSRTPRQPVNGTAWSSRPGDRQGVSDHHPFAGCQEEVPSPAGTRSPVASVQGRFYERGLQGGHRWWGTAG